MECQQGFQRCSVLKKPPTATPTGAPWFVEILKFNSRQFLCAVNCRKWSRKKKLGKKWENRGWIWEQLGIFIIWPPFFLLFFRGFQGMRTGARLITKKYKKSSLEPDKHRSFDNLHHFRIFISEDSGSGVLHTPSIQFLYLSFSHKNSWPVEQWTKKTVVCYL